MQNAAPILKAILAAFLASGCGGSASNLKDFKATKPVDSAAKKTIATPLSVDGIMKFINEEHVTQIEDVLSALPDSYKENFVLVHQSRSLQAATPTEPRLIMYGWDARFIMAIGSVPDDKRSNVIEFAELNSAGGAFQYKEIDFNGASPVLDSSPASCAGCHANPTRPIWGDYPTWPGVYGNDPRTDNAIRTDNFIPDDLWPSFVAFSQAAKSHPHYRHLRFQVNPEAQNYTLVGRQDSPNTAFSQEIGNSVAVGTVERLRLQPRYKELRGLLLATLYPVGCITAGAGPDILTEAKRLYDQQRLLDPVFAARFGELDPDLANAMIFRLLGIDRDTELNITALVSEAPVDNYYLWNAGEFLLGDLVAFLLLEDIKADDPQVAAAFASTQSDAASLLTFSGLTGDQRASALGNEDAEYSLINESIFYSVRNDDKSRVNVCQHLAGLDHK